MELFCFTPVVFAVLGLAVRQISFILINGSVFQWLRGLLRRKAYKSSWPWLWGKGHELFTCNICMTAQVAIWFAGAPITLGVYAKWPHPITAFLSIQLPFVVEAGVALWLWFVLSMAFAGAAMGWWWVLSYLPTKLGLLKDEARPCVFRRPPVVPSAWFAWAVAAIEDGCLSIGCSKVKDECVGTNIDWVIQEQVTSGLVDEHDAPSLRCALSLAYSYYCDLLSRGTSEDEAVSLTNQKFFRHPHIPLHHYRLPVIEVIQVNGDEEGPFIWMMGPEAEGHGDVGFATIPDAVENASQYIKELMPDVFVPSKPGLAPKGYVQAVVAIGDVQVWQTVQLITIQ